jgi:ribosomal-protein-alanine acetyltransferase
VRVDDAAQIVPMTAGHLPEILAIERASFHDPWSAASFRDFIRERSSSWVALKKGQVVGYLVTLWVADEIHLLNIVVRADMRRHGLGTRFVAFLLQMAHSRGSRTIFLEVRVSNEAALEFYRKIGFQFDYRRKGYYGDGEDAWVMEFQIPKQDESDRG